MSRDSIRPNDYNPNKMPAGEEHCFHTDGEPMDIVAWHPDSDTGPSDDDHPMVNRTLVEGRSAAGIEEIRTR